VPIGKKNHGTYFQNFALKIFGEFVKFRIGAYILSVSSDMS